MTRYTVRVEYVDDTYWDDGSRWTSHTFKFDKRADALAFALKAATEGCEVRGRNGVTRAFPKPDEIHVERIAAVRWDVQS